MFRFAIPARSILFIVCLTAWHSLLQNAAGVEPTRGQETAVLVADLRNAGIIADRNLNRINVTKRWNGNRELLARLAEEGPTGTLRFFSGSMHVNETIANLMPGTQIESVSFKSCSLTDQGLAKIATTESIESLRIQNCEITDAGLRTLYHMPRLKNIRIWQTDVTVDGIAALQNALPDCEVLADIIPTQSPTLFHALRSAVLATLLQRADDQNEADELWRTLYTPGSKVDQQLKAELTRMRREDDNFLKLTFDNELLLRKSQIPENLTAQIPHAIHEVDPADLRLTPVFRWLLARYEAGRLENEPASLILLEHYMKAIK